MTNFADHTYEVATKTIRSWKDAANDIYAISFYVEHEDDDPRFGVLNISYNTSQHWQAATSDASDEAEAKWNYAFWSQDFKATIGSSADCCPGIPPDTQGIELRQKWLKTLGLDFADDDDDGIDDNTDRLIQEFVELCVSTAKRLHDSGVIRETFDRDVPILVHELEYYEQIAAQTRRANPEGLTVEFEAWIADLYL